MDHDSAPPPQDALAAATRDLELARRELKWVRIEQEHLAESLQRVRRQRAKLRDQVGTLSEALADSLSAAYWAAQPSGGGLRGALSRRGADRAEADLVREVEATPEFDAAWYVRSHPEVVAQQVAPALHLVRHGNERRLNPGPGFNTAAYLDEHPEAAASGLPAVLHAQRHGHAPGHRHDESATPSDVHL